MRTSQNDHKYGLSAHILITKCLEIPAPLAAPLVGLTAMVASDVPIVALRVGNPKTWGISGWLADTIPHLIYGIVTVATHEALSK